MHVQCAASRVHTQYRQILLYSLYCTLENTPLALVPYGQMLKGNLHVIVTFGSLIPRPFLRGRGWGRKGLHGTHQNIIIMVGYLVY